MKNSLFEKFVNTFSWLGYGLTCFLSCYAVSKIMNSPEPYWIGVAILAGAVVNTTELLSWHKFNRNNSEKSRLEVLVHRAYTDSDRNECEILLQKRQKWHPLAICILMSLLSITGSIFSLQTGYDRGKEIEKVQDAVMKQLALREGVIKEYQLNSQSARYQADIKRRLSNMYLNKSDDFLRKAEDMLGSNAQELEYLKNNVENKIALNIYNNYSTLFGGKPETWAIFFNTLLSFIIEAGFLYLAYEAYHTNNPKAYIKEMGEKEPTIRRKEPVPEPRVAHADTGHTPVPATPQESGSQCDVTPLTPQVTVATGDSQGNTFGHTQGNTKPIGFRIHKNGTQPPTKLQQEIIEVYEEHKKRNLVEDLNISELARVAHRSRKYVYTTLQTFTDFQARNK